MWFHPSIQVEPNILYHLNSIFNFYGYNESITWPAHSPVLMPGDFLCGAT